MDSIVLSLCIPTFNRVKYLRELIPSLIAELEHVNRLAIRVELLISDNASTDETEAYLREISCCGLKIFRNSANIGGDRNFLACVERASGEYVWLFGDDDVIEPDGLKRTVSLLLREHPTLLILRDCGCWINDNQESIYADYGACVREEMKQDYSFALRHTLITANVFRRDIFDLKRAIGFLFTNYAHMYGILIGLRHGGRVAVRSGIFRTRPQRAPFHRWPTALCVKQAFYLWQLAGWFGVKRLRWTACRYALNMPVEIIACVLHNYFPNKFGRT